MEWVARAPENHPILSPTSAGSYIVVGDSMAVLGHTWGSQQTIDMMRIILEKNAEIRHALPLLAGAGRPYIYI